MFCGIEDAIVRAGYETSFFLDLVNGGGEDTPALALDGMKLPEGVSLIAAEDQKAIEPFQVAERRRMLFPVKVAKASRGNDLLYSDSFGGRAVPGRSGRDSNLRLAVLEFAQGGLRAGTETGEIRIRDRCAIFPRLVSRALLVANLEPCPFGVLCWDGTTSPVRKSSIGKSSGPSKTGFNTTSWIGIGTKDTSIWSIGSRDFSRRGTSRISSGP